MADSNEMTGGEAIARLLRAQGIGPMFGMGGFQLLPFYDAARRLGLTHSLINDERSGVFAADAYAKITQRVGVVDATLGPGATNLVTGLVEALNAGTPLVAVVGNSHRLHSWKNMTQESRQIEILRPAAKELIRVEMIERLPELVRRAFQVATSGRPGPVVLDIPEDICHATYPFNSEELDVIQNYQSAPAMRMRPSQSSILEAVKMLEKSKSPLILAGGGIHISDATNTLENFAEKYGIPVAHTMTGKGAIACTNQLNAGLFGRYDRIANNLIENSDCLLVIGCKLGEIATKRFTLPPNNIPLIHIEVMAEEIGRTLQPDVSLWGDARETIEELDLAMSNDAKRQLDLRTNYCSHVAEKMEEWRKSVAPRLNSEEVPINMARLMNELNLILPRDAILVADGGFAAHWGGLLFDTKKAGRGFLPDRGFASIGYGLPGAMGASLAEAGPVVSITGDGGFNMTLGELETARRMNLAFTIIVVNNAASGYVKALQHLMYGEGAYQSSDLAETNYASTAEALGCKGIRVEDPNEIRNAISKGLNNKDCPTVIDLVVTRDPGKMLPGVDNRAATIKKGDRVA
ncbi:MAG: thiamine pyrophosphate-binding protein [Pseudomonadota bacterium]|nr:thiamine pyrophosphate-binding protein [Pseudomonadota bacterium]MEC9044848.1 thiamine pyrophosphate-binding protein [Pseudomonadota bacterium]MED5227219.1 thiamine pyrophosphate-binding protein [Pseudomonadota bacterium]